MCVNLSTDYLFLSACFQVSFRGKKLNVGSNDPLLGLHRLLLELWENFVLTIQNLCEGQKAGCGADDALLGLQRLSLIGQSLSLLHRVPEPLIVSVILTPWRTFKLSVTLYTKLNCARSRRSITDDAQSQLLLQVTSPCSVDAAAIRQASVQQWCLWRCTHFFVFQCHVDLNNAK